MPNVSFSDADALPKFPRKRAPKVEPTEADFVKAVEDAQTRLRQHRTYTRDKAIVRLGTLAFRAGLAPADDDELKTEFADLAKRLLHGAGLIVLYTVGIATLALTLTGCVPQDRTPQQQRNLELFYRQLRHELITAPGCHPHAHVVCG